MEIYFDFCLIACIRDSFTGNYSIYTQFQVDLFQCAKYWSYQNSGPYLSWLLASYKYTSPLGALLQYSVRRSMD
jgi:hypothetical protein